MDLKKKKKMKGFSLFVCECHIYSPLCHDGVCSKVNFLFRFFEGKLKAT